MHPRAPEVDRADLIDLLLDALAEDRLPLLMQFVRNGAVRREEAEEVMAQVARLERAAAPRSDRTVGHAAATTWKDA